MQNRMRCRDWYELFSVCFVDTRYISWPMDGFMCVSRLAPHVQFHANFAVCVSECVRKHDFNRFGQRVGTVLLIDTKRVQVNYGLLSRFSLCQTRLFLYFSPFPSRSLSRSLHFGLLFFFRVIFVHAISFTVMFHKTDSIYHAKISELKI